MSEKHLCMSCYKSSDCTVSIEVKEIFDKYDLGGEFTILVCPAYGQSPQTKPPSSESSN